MYVRKAGIDNTVALFRAASSGVHHSSLLCLYVITASHLHIQHDLFSSNFAETVKVYKHGIGIPNINTKHKVKQDCAGKLSLN